MNTNEIPSQKQWARFSVAPMMDWTDRHCRAFHRALTRRALLYTEMVTADAVLFGDRARLLGFDPVEHPVALQLGGSDPAKLAEAAAIGAAWGYDEINLNVGCPSDRVQEGRFGACLMREAGLVAGCLAAMRAAVPDRPVTVKCRLGVDEQDPATALPAFVEQVAEAGVSTFIVHARKAWLKGLSPRENREVPPLDYDIVRRLKQNRPDLVIVLNGGIGDLSSAEEACSGLDGVMLGRAAYRTPAILLDVDRRFFASPNPVADRAAAVAAYRPYLARRLEEGTPLAVMTRHMLGLYHARPGGRLWRRALSEDARRPGAGLEVLDAALADVERPALASAAGE